MPEETKKRGGGPKTPEGKARASQNSTKHGMCTRHRLVLEDETLDDYNRHYDGWLYDFPTESFTQRELLEQVILNAWLMKRATRRGIDLEATVSSNPAEWTAEQEHKLELMQRYKGSAERAFYRSLAVLRQLDKDLVRHDLLVKKLNSEITELEKKVARQAPPATSNPQGLADGGVGVQGMSPAKWKEQIVNEATFTVKDHVQPCGGNLPRLKRAGRVRVRGV